MTDYNDARANEMISLARSFDSMKLCCTMALGCENAICSVRDHVSNESFRKPLRDYLDRLYVYREVGFFRDRIEEFEELLKEVDLRCLDHIENHQNRIKQ